MVRLAIDLTLFWLRFRIQNNGKIIITVILNKLLFNNVFTFLDITCELLAATSRSWTFLKFISLLLNKSLVVVFWSLSRLRIYINILLILNIILLKSFFYLFYLFLLLSLKKLVFLLVECIFLFLVLQIWKVSRFRHILVLIILYVLLCLLYFDETIFSLINLIFFKKVFTLYLLIFILRIILHFA